MKLFDDFVTEYQSILEQEAAQVQLVAVTPEGIPEVLDDGTSSRRAPEIEVVMPLLDLGRPARRLDAMDAICFCQSDQPGPFLSEILSHPRWLGSVGPSSHRRQSLESQ